MRTHLLASVILLLHCAGLAPAQCRRGQILTGEDEHFWYCFYPSEFPAPAANLVVAMDRAAHHVNPGKSLDLATQARNCSEFFRGVGREIGATSPEWRDGNLDANLIID